MYNFEGFDFENSPFFDFDGGVASSIFWGITPDPDVFRSSPF